MGSDLRSVWSRSEVPAVEFLKIVLDGEEVRWWHFINLASCY